MKIEITNLGWCIFGIILALLNLWINSFVLSFLWGLCFGQIFLNLRKEKRGEK